MEKEFIIERFDNSKFRGYLSEIGDYQPDHTAKYMVWTNDKSKAKRFKHNDPYISKEFSACIHLAPCEFNFRIIENQ
jgi:hypothetical protein